LRARSAFTSAVLASLLGMGLRWAPPPDYAPSPPRLVALDVGRGDALIVQGRRAAVLVDGAAAAAGRFDLGRSAVVPALRALGIQRLDRVVATHADQDHRGGLPAVLEAMPVDALWLPPGGRAEGDFRALLDVARRRGVPVEEIGKGTGAVTLGDLRVTPLWPPAGAGTPRNERSLALAFELAGRRVLLLGDLGVAELALLRGDAPLQADVLLLPHHGSRGSGSAALLDAVSAEIALVSAPCPSQRGLPHPATLARARARGASLWWTGRDGAVFVGLGETLVAAPYASPRRCEAPAHQRSMPSTSRS
jgi:competence protein ComEC